MTEEAKAETIKAVKSAPIAKPINVNDVDASWDGKGSLDEHRVKAFKEIKQPGFGAAGKVKANGE